MARPRKLLIEAQRLMADHHGVVCSMSRSGNVWDNAPMESFFSSLAGTRPSAISTRLSSTATGISLTGCPSNRQQLT